MSAVDRPAATVDVQDAAERRRAARALMLHPLMAADGPHADEVRLVRRHQGELTRLFAHGLGYRLQVDPGVVRLVKGGLGRDPSRPLRRRTGAPFTPRGYALWCLTIAALTRSRSQLLVDELVAQVRSAAVDAGLDVDLDAVGDRRALHAAIIALVELGVLRERDGDLEHWVDQRTQSLLDVRRDLLALLVAAPLTGTRSADDLLQAASLPSAIGGARIATRRTLVESPVLTTEELPEEYAEWWRRNRHRERDWYETNFGLSVELRAEGAAAFDPDESFTDESFPGADKTRQLALLILESLVDAVHRAPDVGVGDAGGAGDAGGVGDAGGGGVAGGGGAWRGLPTEQAQAAARAVRERWHDKLRRDQREDPERAVRDALVVLVRFGLLRQDPTTTYLHAAATRYAPRIELAQPRATGERSLFDLDDEGR